MVLFPVFDGLDSFVDVELVYGNKNDPGKNPNLRFDFQVVYTRVGASGDSDDLETLTVWQTHDLEREWIFGGDIDETQDIVCFILENINVPCYRNIVKRLTKAILDLKDREASCVLPKVKRVKVKIDVTVWRLPVEEEDVDVKLAVAPASGEAVEAHLETLVVENGEGYCVICMDTIRVESEVAAVRMPCLHVFHRTCGVKWLRNSGICPVCRAVFPS